MKLDKSNQWGGNRTTSDRKGADAFFTPTWCVDILLDSGVLDLRGKHILEPSSGDGKIHDRLVECGYDVEGRDLHDWGRGWGGHDFFAEHDAADAIITNPPFNRINDYIKHALTRAPVVAILGRTLLVESKGRYPIWRDTPPQWIIQLPHRPDFLTQRPDKSGTVVAAWFVWDGSGRQETRFIWAPPVAGVK